MPTPDTKPIRTVQEVNNALQQVNQLNQQLTEAINQLQPLSNNDALKSCKIKFKIKLIKLYKPMV